MTFLTLFIGISATWRLTNLLCNEDGPFHIFAHIRKWADHLTTHNKFWQTFHLSEGIHCEWCASIWIAVPLTVVWYFLGDKTIWLLLPFCLSTWVIVFKYLIQTLAQIQTVVDKLAAENKKSEGDT